MKLTIEINTDNAAFEDNYELGRIVEEIGAALYASDISTMRNKKLYDINGNHVGFVKITD